MKTATIIWIVVGLIAIALIIWWIMSLTNVPETPLNVPQNGDVTMMGTIVCLPHRDTSGPQTLECAYGLRDDNDNYYGLTDEDSSAAPITSFSTESRVEVRGVFTLGEDERYATVGVIEVEEMTLEDGTIPGETTSLSDGTIAFDQPEDFGLAVTNDQILVTSTIPPCTEEFSYCLYYDGASYGNTNFSSAGVSLRQRADLTTEASCLATQPAGYTGLESSTSTGTGYAMSLFAPLDDAAAGSYSTGEDYRLFASSTCYQFITRVGETQFANAATGTVEFTEAERNSLLDTLRNIVGNIRLESNDQRISLPAEIE
jgi:hypothetical protein